MSPLVSSLRAERCLIQCCDSRPHSATGTEWGSLLMTLGSSVEGCWGDGSKVTTGRAGQPAPRGDPAHAGMVPSLKELGAGICAVESHRSGGCGLEEGAASVEGQGLTSQEEGVSGCHHSTKELRFQCTQSPLAKLKSWVRPVRPTRDGGHRYCPEKPCGIYPVLGNKINSRLSALKWRGWHWRIDWSFDYFGSLILASLFILQTRPY